MLSKLKTGFITTLVSLIGLQEIQAQKVVVGYGVSLWSDIITFTPESPDGFYSPVEPRIGLNFLNASLEMKYSLHEFNEDMALSLFTSPCVGIGFSLSGNSFGTIRMPLYAQLDYGKLSTFDSKNNLGIGVGIGYQIERHNIIGEVAPVSFGTVAARIGFRFFETNELAFKIGFPKTLEIPSTKIDGSNKTVNYYQDVKVASYNLSLIWYPNY